MSAKLSGGCNGDSGGDRRGNVTGHASAHQFVAEVEEGRWAEGFGHSVGYDVVCTFEYGEDLFGDIQEANDMMAL